MGIDFLATSPQSGRFYLAKAKQIVTIKKAGESRRTKNV
jgi:hypothetical protein